MNLHCQEPQDLRTGCSCRRSCPFRPRPSPDSPVWGFRLADNCLFPGRPTERRRGDTFNQSREGVGCQRRSPEVRDSQSGWEERYGEARLHHKRSLTTHLDTEEPSQRRLTSRCECCRHREPQESTEGATGYASQRVIKGFSASLSGQITSRDMRRGRA